MLGAGPVAEQLTFERPAQRRKPDLAKWPQSGVDGGCQDKVIDPSRPFHQAGDRCLVGEVRFYALQVHADRPPDRTQPLRVAPPDQHLGTLPGSKPGCFETGAGRPTDDQGALRTRRHRKLRPVHDARSGQCR